MVDIATCAVNDREPGHRNSGKRSRPNKQTPLQLSMNRRALYGQIVRNTRRGKRMTKLRQSIEAERRNSLVQGARQSTVRP
jgi:hypothetical protein